MNNVLHVAQPHLLMREGGIVIADYIAGMMYATHLPMCLTNIKYSVKVGFCHYYFWFCWMVRHKRIPLAILSVRQADSIYTYSCVIPNLGFWQQYIEYVI